MYNIPTILTICYPMTASQILLGKKKKKPNAKHYVYGVGLFNGFGGHKKDNETTLQTAIRELKDECGLISTILVKVGIVLVYYKDSQKLTELHFYITTSFKGEVVETNEMRPIWCNKENIPLDQMWPNDAFYMDMILNGTKFIGFFVFNNPNDRKLLSQQVKKIETLPDHLDYVEFIKSLNLQ